MTMRSMIFKCPPWMIGLPGGLAPLGIVGLVRREGWPPMTVWILVGITVFLVVYALLLLPRRLPCVPCARPLSLGRWADKGDLHSCNRNIR